MRKNEIQNSTVKPKKPIYKRVWFILLIVFILIFIIAAVAGGGEDSPSSKSSSSSKTTQETTHQNKTQQAVDKMTASQKNAYKSALNYLDTQPFSKQGLIEQLSSEDGEGYPEKDAEFAVNFIEKHHEVNWNKQAYKAAKEYLENDSFSESGLIEQLESSYGEGFTHEQAVYGAHKAYAEQN